MIFGAFLCNHMPYIVGYVEKVSFDIIHHYILLTEIKKTMLYYTT
jgi:hypothetical protein